MKKIRPKNTKPELRVRSYIHRMGYRYRLHRKDLPGKPDLVFPSRRKVIFVHGCFWHQHPDPSCKITRRPKSNRDYWLPKLERNAARDAEHQKNLRKLGWKVMVLWECEIEAGKKLDKRLSKFLGT